VIVDSSALIAILTDEPERAAMVEAVLSTPQRTMSAATWLESAMVVDARNDPVLSRRFDDAILTFDIEIGPVTPAHALTARRAFTDFGKGRHRAGLNFGDCFSYALASTQDEPLLCKGNDFRHTDIEIVELSSDGP